MNIESFLLELRSVGVTFSVEGGKLRSRSAKGALTPEAQARIRERKDEIIAFLSAALEGGTNDVPLVPVGREAPLPLSFSQQRLWFLDRLEPGSAFYNIPTALRMVGRLDQAALRGAVAGIVQRHESLRTTFSMLDGAPVQVIADRLELPFECTDLSHIVAAEREETALQLALKAARGPFDLEHGPLIRICLFRLEEQEHLFVAVMHHIVSDGWSMGVLVTELAALYRARLGGADAALSTLPVLPIQYADFAAWQRRWLSGAVMARQLDYWRRHLSGAPALLALPTDRPRPAVQGHAGANYSFFLDAAIMHGLGMVAQREQTTLFMVLASVFSILLGRYAAQTDVCLGMPIANRTRAETEPLIGFFLNTLVLRTEIDESESFISLLRQVRQATLEAYDNQDLPFEQLVDALKPDRSAAYSPLFQVMLILQNTPMEELELPGLVLLPAPLELGTSRTDMRLSVTESPRGLACAVEYRTDLFDETSVAAMAQHLQRLCRAVLADPHCRVGALTMRSDEEVQEIAAYWNRLMPDYARLADHDLLLEQPWENVLDAIAQAVARDGQAPAIRYRGQALSYAELDCRANRMANALVAAGAVKGSNVALLLADPVQQIVALLGVLKAGAVFACLNPAFPPQRLAGLLDIVEPACVIAEQGASVLPASWAGHVPVLPADAAALEKHAEYTDKAPQIGTGPDDPCYLYFTSGSTGTPKAVLGRIRGLAQFIQWEIAEFGLDQSTRVSQLTIPGFDVYLRDVFAGLCAGGTVCIPAADTILDARALLQWLEAEAVTHIHCVPTVLRSLFDAPLSADSLPVLGHVLLAGEALLPADTNRWIALFGSRARLVNLYGPTETTLAKFLYRLPAEPVDESFIPVGRPIPGAQAFLFDERMELCAPGQAGEVHIRTPYRSLGYYRRDELNAGAFVSNPLTGGGDLLYKTGDLGVMLPDGHFRLLGRKDFQVKIRGMRVEPGEVEAILANLPGVRECAVLAQSDNAGTKRLVAYVAPAEAQDAVSQRAALTSALAAALPDYMLPSQLIFLAALPRTPNGKLDRKALPEADFASSDVPYVAPRDETEERIAAIWCEVLRRERIGVEENFFDVGGHSLLATQVVAKLVAAFSIELPLRALFESATVAALAHRVRSALGEEKQGGADAIVAVPRQGGEGQLFPASFGQQRLWFLDQLDKGNPLYNITVAVRLTGRLDAAALERAFRELVQRHEVLRSVFVEQEGKPMQAVLAAPHIEFETMSFEDLPEAQRETFAARCLQEAAQRRFDLSAGPLLHSLLMRLAPELHQFALVLHHVVTDSWSTGILLRELAALYTSYAQGTPTRLPPLAIQYPDYAQWQRDNAEQGFFRRQRDYWLHQLAQCPTLLNLPTDRPRGTARHHRGAVLPFEFGALELAEVKVFCRTSGATLFMVLAAAFNAVLARHSGQDDICIGTPIANRHRADVEAVVGFFINTLVLRTRVELDARFSDLLAQVRDTALAAYANQDVPFEHLVDLLRPDRSGGQSPLFQVMLALQNTPQSRMDLPDLSMEPIAPEASSAKFDLTLNVTEGDDRLFAFFEYDTDLFDAATIARMAEHFQRLLLAAVRRPATRIADLPLLGEQEKEGILAWSCADNEDYDRKATIHGLFEAVAAAQPEAVALAYGGHAMSYGELNRRSNRLAHALRERGARPDVLVGLALERSFDMVVGLLAILKAGAAYLPLDPSYPKERLAAMLADAAPALVVARAALDLPPHVVQLAYVGESAGLARYPATDPALAVDADNLAYVMFTSGSTGRPKGATSTHRNVVRLVVRAGYFDAGPGTRMAQLSTLNFDASTFDIWGALLNGATLVVPPPGPLAAEEIGVLLTDERIDIILLTTALLHQVAGHQGAALRRVRHILTGGEVLSPAAVRQLLLGGESRALHLTNGYGPTECTTYSTCLDIPASDARNIAVDVPLSIGRPMARTQAYVLDAGFELVPAGVAGELYIGGDGLGRGYLNRPELTAERFVPNPYGAPGSRLYRTGDLVRHLPDGKIDFLGRIDRQVKIRGFRIEPGEVEAALTELPSVAAAVALVREAATGRRLVAYVARREGTADDGAALRSALRLRLPEYMIPSHITVLDDLPLNANGKVDKAALPAPEFGTEAGARVAPRNDAEARLCAIWAEILQLDEVGIYDNFFDLGGHSLLATQAISKVRAAFGCELPLRTVFEDGTPAGLASRIALLEATPQEPPITAREAEAGAALPLSHAQQRLWFLDHFEPGTALYNVSSALKIEGGLDLAALELALQNVMSRHEALRTCFPAVDGEARQRIRELPGTLLAVTDLSGETQAARQARALSLVREESMRPFDLAHGPLVRFTVLRLAADVHFLLLTMHHIVSDGWSMGVLVKELTGFYRAAAAGLPFEAPPLSIQYADYAIWQRRWRDAAALQRQIAYWQRQLRDAPAESTLPPDRPRGAAQNHHGAVLRFSLDAATHAALAAAAREAGATLFMTLAACLQIALARHASQEDVCIGAPIANRNQAEIEPLIGCFINTLVIRSRVDESLPFHDFLQGVRDTTLAAYANQDAPFEQLIEAIKPVRHTGSTPLFQVMFSLHNNPAAAVAIPGLSFSPLEIDKPLAKYDLSLDVHGVHGVLEGEHGLACTLEYDTDLYDAGTAERFAGHFRRLATSAAKEPQARIADLAMLGEAELRQMLLHWNDTARRPVPGDTLHGMFETQVRLAPEAIALEDGDHLLSYGALNAGANRLARRLRSLGVRADSIVAVCMARSFDMVTALLAVWKAGAAYLPLDPDTPDERLDYMLADAAPVAAIADAHLAPRLQRIPALALCVPAQEHDLLAGLPAGDLDAGATDGNLAYVIYTSGSTGRPKGVLTTHRNAANLALSHIHDLYRPHASRIGKARLCTSFNAPYYFDASISELVLLLDGHTLVIVPEETRRSPRELLDLIATRRLDGLDSSPAQLRALLDEGGDAGLPSIVLFGGEAVDEDLWRRLNSITGTRFFNAYGPTECTVDVALYELGHGAGRPLIGKPQANTRFYLLDKLLRPVPLGAAGELFIGGAGVVRGYLNRPSLSAEKFLPDPFSPEPGARMYRSGDLARLHADGNVEYLGRADGQVKLRGYRIELGEIEAALRACPEVREAVASVQAVGGNMALAAYVVPEADPHPPLLETGQAASARELSIAGLDAAWEIVADGQASVLAVPAGVPVLHDAAARQYRVYPLAAMPYAKADFDTLHLDAWPRYFDGAAVLKRLWSRMYERFPHSQMLIQESLAATIGVGNAVPLAWDGSRENLPRGWDGALEQALAEDGRGVEPDTLVVLAGIIDPRYRDRKAAHLIVDAFKALACSLGLRRVLVALRPVAKSAHQAMPIAEYSRLADTTGRLFDGWLRLHCDAGGTVVGWEEHSQSVEGSLDEWEQWSGQRFAQSGARFLADTLAPVMVDVESGRARYDDPCIWVEHPLQQQEPAGRIDMESIASLVRRSCSRMPARVIVIDAPGTAQADRLRAGDAATVLAALQAYARKLPGAGDIRNRLSRILPAHMVPPHIVFLERLPSTPSGKIDRQALPIPDPSAAIDETYVAPETDAERILCSVWAAVLGLPRVGADDNFFAIGGDSILSIRVVAQARQRGLHFSTKDMFRLQSVRELARHARSGAAGVQEEKVTGESPLLPVQADFFEEGEQLHHFNQSLLLEAPPGLDAATIERIAAALLKRHDALRLFFVRTDERWTACHREFDAALVAESVAVESLAGLDEAQYPAALSSRGEYFQSSFNLERGPLFRIVWFDAEPGRSRLLLIAHHLVVDGVSWRILLKDMEQAYRQAVAGQEIALERKSSSYQRWGRFLESRARSRELAHEARYWIAQDAKPADRLPAGLPAADDSFAGSAKVGLSLDEEQTAALLGRCHHAYRTQINDLLLAGLLLGLAQWGGMCNVRIDLEGHGRETLSEEIDLSDTVGWFTSIFPVVLALPPEGPADTGAVIRAVREILRAVPAKGIGYGLLRRLASGLPALRVDKSSSIVFNYLGQAGSAGQSAFAVAREFAGNRIGRGMARSHALGFNGAIYGNRLAFELDYNGARFTEAEMRDLAQAVVAGWQRVIAHCGAIAPAARMAADFSFEELASGTAPLMPNNYLFFSRKDLNHWNASDLLEIVEPLGPQLVERAVARLLEHHDGLRRVWKREEGGWCQHFLLPSEMAPWWSIEDLAALPDESIGAEIERRCAAAQVSLKIDSLLFRAIYFDLGPRRNARLMFAVHHLLLDAFSSPILIEDLEHACAALRIGMEAVLPPKTMSMKALSEALQDYAASPEVAASLDYWRSRPWERFRPLPSERQSQLLVAGDTGLPHTIADCLGVEDTVQLEKLPKLLDGVVVEDVVLAALVRAYGKWTGSPALPLAAAHNGRSYGFDEKLDLSRTVGWCTNQTCHALDLSGCGSARQAVDAIRRQRLETRGTESHYSLLRHMHPDPAVRAEMNSMLDAPLEFYHVPRLSASIDSNQAGPRAFARASEDAGSNDGPMHAGFRPFGFGVFHGERFWIRWTYCRTAFAEDTFRSFLGDFLDTLRGMIVELAAQAAQPAADRTGEEVGA